ncbi:MAG TPA: N-acetyl-gamma-glutamyl-phosphate reductase [Solirubrobacteraceae bacterium]|nr:N-acetyl-gamma-glutamyl-phosphate reductase [Solirubrobacteraceae bacterium]
MPDVAVIGASGFTGALAAHLLWRHPRFDLVAVTARSGAGRRLDDLSPRHRVPLMLEELELDRHGDVDAAVVAYPHGASSGVVAQLRRRGARVVDLSADFRLRDLAVYEQWYGSGHEAPALIGDAAYGLSELHRERIAAGDLVANPGCFPVAVLLTLAPLARARLIGEAVVDGKTGVSGAGRAATEKTHFVTANENVNAYGVGRHRHTPEMEQELAALGADVPLTFTPHLLPLDQGELVSCYVTPARETDDAELAGLYAEAYDGEPFVELTDRPPGVRDVRDTNVCRIAVTHERHTGRILAFGAIDNLWKGASSQAVQNLNLMFGLGEGEGIA